ncbi:MULTISPECIES: substrate-binding domain-containing protein [Actinosynnema]|uniref:substrate-binding domain-containing protein n=1 Tax=Actinosynnema TaxID=40566 RepID=UPI0020A5C8C6|nr:substrate-binding domain-containing protein [Actinosynnema pretiosum]MCP2095538.1 Ca-activated chloride channel family protein [Actinosynnema pretiosum]
MRRAALLLAVAALLAPTACTTTRPPEVRLTALAAPELADLAPLLPDLRRDTGVELVLDHRETLGADLSGHDLAWLPSTRYLRIAGGELPLATPTMTSPLVLAVKRDRAPGLRGGTWADVAQLAASGGLRFGLADPHRADSGLSALIGVATAAAGTGSALRPQDVACDKLGGLLTGLVRAEPDAATALAGFARRDDVDAVVGYESELLRLADSGRVPGGFDLVRPRDGVVLADYPLLLVRPEHREAYDRVVAWLRSDAVQRRIAETTARRPVDPALPRPERLSEEIGTALYFPAEQAVVDAVLAAYDRAAAGLRGSVVFVLDYSLSMRGERIAQLRDVFARLSGGGGFDRFALGERITVVRFAGRVLDERTVVVDGQAALDELAAVLASDDLGEGTALWTALRRGQELAGDGPVVLVTDGESNAGIGFEEYLAGPRGARTYAIRVGEADPAELDRAARASGGRVVDATGSLTEAVGEIRGCR